LEDLLRDSPGDIAGVVASTVDCEGALVLEQLIQLVGRGDIIIFRPLLDGRLAGAGNPLAAVVLPPPAIGIAVFVAAAGVLTARVLTAKVLTAKVLPARVLPARVLPAAILAVGLAALRR
jgi:hypothetical protein